MGGGRLAWTLALAGACFAADAGAYETDQLTWRDRPLTDATAPANEELTRLLDAAVERTNRVTSCKADDERTHRVLAKIVFRSTSARRWVWTRGFWRAPGFGVYSKWLETTPEADRFAFADREDLFGDVTLADNAILHVAGPCSTFVINGVRVGSDKLDHFLYEGFRYWQESKRGTDVQRAVDRGTHTEMHIYGLSTSKVFSFADLAANWDGYRFYEGLLGPASVIERGEDGCLQRVEEWDWARYVDWRYDEVLVPSVYAPRIQERITETLAARSDEYCAALQQWAPEGWEAVRAAHPLDLDAPWIGPEVPEPLDPYRLDQLCAGDLASPD